MQRDGVLVAFLKWLTVPGGPTVGEDQAASQANRVVLVKAVTPAQLEARDQRPAPGNMDRACLDERGTLLRGTEKWHVASHHHDVKLTTKRQVSQVRLHPLELRGTAPCLTDHRLVYVDANDIYALARQFDRHSPGAASCVKYRTRAERENKGRLTMDVDPVVGQSVEPGLVRPPVEVRHGEHSTS